MSLIAQHTELLLILACVFGFFMAWGIGANDVANAMGTSVGSGAITIWQAVIIAGIFEFLGAWLAGGEVTQTISGGLIKPEVVAAQPDLLVIGMLSALVGAGTFLLVMSTFGMPVSTGQSIIGGILGFALVAFGAGPINWGEILSIVMSWIASPIIAGGLAFLLFESIRRLVLENPDPAAGARRYIPGYVFLAALVICLVTLIKGLSHIGLNLSLGTSIAISIGIGLAVAAGAALILKRVDLTPEARASDKFRNVERVFGYAQIFTAATMAFAHGSNDVANAVGPLAAIINTLAHPGEISGQSEVAGWVLVLGGAGIVFGLATYGHRVIKTIGGRITELTPTRGFSAELSAASTVVLATWFGIPVSTTQTLVGGVLGVGLARGMRALDLSVLGGVFAGWILTLPGAALFSIVFYYLLHALL
ncbi:inorganic phosphate transporter [Salinisphaera japonica]|uniref:Phosphate transporter n=1 Tax=Salinisphaera japonica YTM-1 TaxID=1209778 RepID=A0A423PT39_9GAMM|nr:inorganic phosphate transporter [Salinisphaera japonica]ROO28763.1 phosphate permease [Salinisphaera japonica YTM-1]